MDVGPDSFHGQTTPRVTAKIHLARDLLVVPGEMDVTKVLQSSDVVIGRECIYSSVQPMDDKKDHNFTPSGEMKHASLRTLYE